MAKNNRIFNFSVFALIVLFLQNLIIYWNHYFNEFFFLGDFPRAAFARIAFWTASIDSGIFPHWVPFQSMGYPFFMIIQSALYYPFLWIFPLFNIEYTLNAAAIFQIIHIFFGAVGMFFLLKLLFKSPKYAFIGAFAFQFFGAFYTSTAFPDVTRALTLAPWMFYVLTLNVEKSTLSRRVLFIPIITYLIITGSYPGNIISSLFIMIVFVFLQSFNTYLQSFKKIKSIKTLVVLLSLIFLGIGISVIHIGPFAENFDQLVRSQHYSNLNFEKLSFDVLPSLFMPSQWTQDIGTAWTMSYFVTLPILILSSFAPLSSIKKYWVFLVILILGFLMASGKNTPFWEMAGMIFSPLNISRLPVSDYKIFVAIPLVIFAIAGLKYIVEMKINFKQIAFRIAFVLSWFSILISLLYIKSSSIVNPGIKDLEVILSILVVATMIGFILYYVIKNKNLNLKLKKNQLKLSIAFLIILIVIISFDASRVIIPMEKFWMGDPNNPAHSQYTKYNYPLEKNGKLISYSIFENLPEERPEREITEHPLILSWVGYLDGSYMMEDYGRSHMLNNRRDVLRNDIYKEFMMMKWTPILLNSEVTNSKKIDLPIDVFTNLNFPTTEVQQIHYGINEIHYLISTEESYLMVENEMYFQGWKASIIYPDKQYDVESVVVNEIFRGWYIPEGEYKMIAYFETPNLILYQIISISSFIICIIIIIVYFLRTRTGITIRQLNP